MLTLYGIANCDTVKKARAWLAGAGVEHRFHDYKKTGVPDEALARWIAALGWEALLNRQGTTWRKLDPARPRLAGRARQDPQLSRLREGRRAGRPAGCLAGQRRLGGLAEPPGHDLAQAA